MICFVFFSFSILRVRNWGYKTCKFSRRKQYFKRKQKQNLIRNRYKTETQNTPNIKNTLLMIRRPLLESPVLSIKKRDIALMMNKQLGSLRHARGIDAKCCCCGECYIVNKPCRDRGCWCH